MKVEIANHGDRQRIEIDLNIGSIHSLSVAQATDLRNMLDEQIRAAQQGMQTDQDGDTDKPTYTPLPGYTVSDNAPKPRPGG